MCASQLQNIQLPRRHPRGVLLLVVLSMLTLFLLMGITFIILASRARTVSRAYLNLADQQQQTSQTLQPFVRDAALQVMRGSVGASALKAHDLLGDRYGSTAEENSVTDAGSRANDNLLRLVLQNDIQLEKTGHVLYFVTGPSTVQGHGTRIVDVDIVRDNNNQVLETAAIIPWPESLSVNDISLLKGTNVKINHRDFYGHGISVVEEKTPNWSLVGSLPSSVNEDYDAVDLQNIALAKSDQLAAVASYHRASIIDDWVELYRTGMPNPNNATTIDAQNAIFNLLQQNPNQNQTVLKGLRRATLRPFPFDHYQNLVPGTDFAGRDISNATAFFDLIRGLKDLDNDGDLDPFFDVDTDGDGTLDSMWIDTGREPFKLSDKTLVKPLAAIRCIDLGGRVNLNAHGSLAHLINSQPANDSALVGQSNESDPYSFLINSQPVGLGYGPADVRLDAVISADQMQGVFLGRSQQSVKDPDEIIYRKIPSTNGRYGGGVRQANNEALPGRSDGIDTMGFIGSLASKSPTDFWSRLSMGLDRRGHPRYYKWLNRNDTTNSPYELNLFEGGSVQPYVPIVPGNITTLDQPFSATELEAFLRVNDTDTSALLPQRLLGLFLESDETVRNVITTESWDTPAIVGEIPTLSEGSSNPEIRRGLKLNLNSPFGNGSDDDDDGIVDEPDETEDEFFAASGSGWNLTRGETPAIGQPGKNLAGVRARQMMAHNIYDLLKFLKTGSGIAEPTNRELAQWAVNVVDYIDSDSIMTPYRYAAGNSDQNVVWGCESPDLIVTETIALHDRAIADMDDDDNIFDEDGDDSTPGTKTNAAFPDVADADFDQVRVPQGSIFIELHAVRDRNADSLPQELYSGNTGSWELDLDRVPANGTSPVWRLSFGLLRNNSSEANDPFARLHDIDPNNQQTSEADLNFSPSDSDEKSFPGGFVTDRYAYFTKDLNLPNVEIDRQKPNRYNTFRPTANTKIRCGDYLVAGPRADTHLGSTTANVGEKSRQKVEVRANGVGIQWLDPEDPIDSTYGFDESKGVVLRANSAPGANWQDIGLNISEPQGFEYYSAPPAQPQPDSNQSGPVFATPIYGPLSADVNAKYPDKPGDSDDSVGSPLRAAGMLAQGTHLNASTVFVERLADPTRPFEPDADSEDWNPYIVVDFMPIDLNVFNGETSTKDPDVGNNLPWYVQTRQRGFDAWIDQKKGDGKDQELFSLEAVLDDEEDANFSKYPWRPCSPWEEKNGAWAIRPPQPKASTAQSRDVYFDYDIGDTYDDEVPTHTLGWCNLSQGKRVVGAGQFAGAPANPFPWIVWKDGPLANPYELLMVPRTSASRLLTNYRDVGSLTDAGVDYKDANDIDKPFGVDEDQPFGATRPGHHLLPLTSITDRPLDKNNPSTPVSDSLSKLFAYVRTPSPFAGTRNEMNVANDDNTTPAFFKPPFDQIETYREPGAININTIENSNVWNAILGNINGNALQPAWADVQNVLPVRTPNGMRQDNFFPTRATTLLKDTSPGEALFSTPTNGDYDAFSSERSSWFRFAQLMRASANTTARSEVYAIWVTVGLFEVERVGEGKIGEVTKYPNNYKLLREYGSSTGEIKRYRGFYIFDRSRPICYDPGVDHNVEDGILVERFIE